MQRPPQNGRQAPQTTDQASDFAFSPVDGADAHRENASEPEPRPAAKSAVKANTPTWTSDWEHDCRSGDCSAGIITISKPIIFCHVTFLTSTKSALALRGWGVELGYECERSVGTVMVLLPRTRNNAAGGMTDVRCATGVKGTLNPHRRHCLWKRTEGQPNTNTLREEDCYGHEGIHVGVIGAVFSVWVGHGEISHWWLGLRSGRILRGSDWVAGRYWAMVEAALAGGCRWVEQAQEVQSGRGVARTGAFECAYPECACRRAEAWGANLGVVGSVSRSASIHMRKKEGKSIWEGVCCEAGATGIVRWVPDF